MMWHPPTAPDLMVTAPPHAWLAVAVAAAGGHHLSLTGASGTGKPLLAKAVHHLQPGHSADTAQQPHRLAQPISTALTLPPWQQPHHTVSMASLTGSLTRDGALALAHQGIVFVDDAAEFPHRHLDAIAAVLARCEVAIAQAGDTRRMPACAQLVLASRPCPCLNPEGCRCGPAAQRHYQRHTVRLRALADVDISLDAIPAGCGFYGLCSGPLAAVEDMVTQARMRRARRPIDSGPWVTSHADYTALRHPSWAIPDRATRRLRELVERGLITVSRSTAAARVAWTLADLAARARPTESDMDTALALHGHTR
jgi:magnesium chelatase family protein